MTAPTTPTGTLTVHDVFVADLNAAIDAVAQHYDACERAGGGDADDDFDAATLCFTLLRRHGVKLRALAAGQAHPQGQGEPVAWYVPRHGKNAVPVMGPTKPDSDPEWAPLYAAQGQGEPGIRIEISEDNEIWLRLAYGNMRAATVLDCFPRHSTAWEICVALAAVDPPITKAQWEDGFYGSR